MRLRWLVLLLVGVGTWAALTMLPSLATAGGGLSGIVGVDHPTIKAQLDVVRRFGLPLLTGTAVVQRNQGGLDPSAAQRALQRALETLGLRAPSSTPYATPEIAPSR